jgi:putative ATP-binding cassette transporter
VKLYQFVQQETGGDRWRFLLAAIGSAAANTAVLAIIGVGLADGGALDWRMWLAFAAICVGYALTYAYCVSTITRRVEAALYKVRLRLGEKIRRADLIALEQIGAARLYDLIVQQTTIISNSSWLIALGLQALVFLVILLLYILYLSHVLFFLFLLGGLLALPLFHSRSQKVTAHMQTVSTQRASLYNLLTDLLRGFKEVRLHTRRGEELYVHFDDTAQGLRDRMVELHQLGQDNVNFMHFHMYVLLAVTVFVLPQFIIETPDTLSQLSAAVLFVTGPLAILGFTVPEYERADVAATNLVALERRLDQAAVAAPEVGADPFAGGFATIEAEGLRFAYPAGDVPAGERFALGPVSITIAAGEIVFFVGGNGSGKTTLLKLLAGLYTPSAGTLRVDRRVIDATNLQSYRELIAAVFTDFHLFKRLYGLSDHAAPIDRLLDQLQIADKTAYGAAGFTNLELSTGQRKRIAMAVALLEDRPLYVFDEWAADQDPELRRYYYEQLLPELKRQGKTVLAISHDDRYFHCADRVVFMDYGTIRSIESHAAPTEAS